eukprot:COSAG01_NODE_68508_length_264_cov_0.533333_1_plen_70_part_01
MTPMATSNTSAVPTLPGISYVVLCLKKKEKWVIKAISPYPPAVLPRTKAGEEGGGGGGGGGDPLTCLLHS